LSRLTCIAYGVVFPDACAITSSRESVDHALKPIGTFKAAHAFEVPISPSGCARRCMAAGENPKGKSTLLPHITVLVSMADTFLSIRGLMRYLSKAASLSRSFAETLSWRAGFLGVLATHRDHVHGTFIEIFLCCYFSRTICDAFRSPRYILGIFWDPLSLKSLIEKTSGSSVGPRFAILTAAAGQFDSCSFHLDRFRRWTAPRH
jgi:hypothetical protein